MMTQSWRVLLAAIPAYILTRNTRMYTCQEIWKEYHHEKSDSLVTTLSGADFAAVTERARASPYFVFPVYRKDGFFNMICQFQDTCFLLTYLEAFKENPGLAPPCLTVSLFDDLTESKDIGLLRADIVNMLDKKVRVVCLHSGEVDGKTRGWAVGALTVGLGGVSSVSTLALLE